MRWWCLACSIVAACSTAGESGPGPAPGSPDARPDDVPPGPDAAPGAPDAATPTGTPFADCFADAFVVPPDPELGPDYDQFGPTIGTHCQGTNHQAIEGIERVVFLGDSVTVGSPPTADGEFYRSRLADALAARFGLPPPGPLWKGVNLFDGRTWVQDDGAFGSCAKWGARTDDLLRDSTQIEDCFPPDKRALRTLVVITIGGNDIASLTKDGNEGKPVPELWAQTEEFVGLLRDAIAWFQEPGKFPNGVFVVYGNMFEFTDATGDTASCPAASLAGFTGEWPDPQAQIDMVVWANEQYLKIAVDTGTDMIFNLEHFCGHGFRADDPASPCFRGPGNARWFDDTCIHPNPTGHDVLADMFLAVVEE